MAPGTRVAFGGSGLAQVSYASELKPEANLEFRNKGFGRNQGSQVFRVPFERVLCAAVPWSKRGLLSLALELPCCLNAEKFVFRSLIAFRYVE